MEQQEYERHFKAMYNAGLAPTLIGKPQAGFEKADLFAGRSNAKRALPLSALMQTVICSQSNGFDPMIGIELDVSRTELIVVDVDSKSPRLQSAVIKRFGSTPWKENTPRGLHLFFKRPAGSLDDDFSVSDLSKVDLLTGHSDRSVIVAPSRNFSGQHYTLSRNPARGGWEYIRNIPEIAQHLVAEGEREKTIFVFARSEARTCRDANELYDRVMKFAYSKIEDPDSFVKEHDLLSMCYRVFNWACQTPYWGGDLYGGAATASEKSYLSQKGKAGRLALILLETVILPNHGTTGLTQSFFLDTRALAKANKIEGWGRQSYRTAIVTLCSAGILLKASSPKFNVECHRNAPIHYRLKRLS